MYKTSMKYLLQYLLYASPIVAFSPKPLRHSVPLGLEYRSSVSSSTTAPLVMNNTLASLPIDMNIDTSHFPSFFDDNIAMEQIKDLEAITKSSSIVDTTKSTSTVDHLPSYHELEIADYHTINNLEDISQRLLRKQHKASLGMHTYHILNKSYSFLGDTVRHKTNDFNEALRRLAYTTIVNVDQKSTLLDTIRKYTGLAEHQTIPSSLRTTRIKKTLDKYDILHWLDRADRLEECILEDDDGSEGVLDKCKQEEMHSGEYTHLSLDLVDEINIPNPGYLHLIKERLWISGFALTNDFGELHSYDVNTKDISSANYWTSSAIKWPNEVNAVPKENTVSCSEGNALLVTDGFLVPGKDKGGLHIVQNPGDEDESRVSLTGITDWFYHKAVWMDLTGDGRQSILCARAKMDFTGKGEGQLVWLERPLPHSYDEDTGTPLNEDGSLFDPFSPCHMPWKSRVLDEGPDVMFSVADLDPSDDTIEIIASQFFQKKVSLHSIKIGFDPQVVFKRVIDDQCGAAFSSVLADLDGPNSIISSTSPLPTVLDTGSTISCLEEGDAFSHLLVTSHECSDAKSVDDNTNQQDTSTVSTTNQSEKIDGGSLFAYRVPRDWRTESWTRSIIATGFKVEGHLRNMIKPGAPGFCYTFFPTREGNKGSNKWRRPLIGLSGDCSESGYILQPIEGGSSTKYSLMSEVKCGSTVGSLAIGYTNTGSAQIYVPCYEQDKILIFTLGEHYSDDDNTSHVVTEIDV